MSFAVTGLLLSILAVLILSGLFRFEEKRGRRFGEGVRRHADSAILRIAHVWKYIAQFFSGDFIQQVFHYIFHTFLRLALLFMRKCEQVLKTVMRVNKTLAKNAERESVTRTKLEEIALHKLSTALTDKEKKERKDKTLRGR